MGFLRFGIMEILGREFTGDGYEAEACEANDGDGHAAYTNNNVAFESVGRRLIAAEAFVV